MMVRLRLSFFELLLLAALTVLCQAQYRGGPDRGNDRSRHYCRLWRHASKEINFFWETICLSCDLTNGLFHFTTGVLAGSKIFIDGGNALMPWERDGGSNGSSTSRWYRGTSEW